MTTSIYSKTATQSAIAVNGVDKLLVNETTGIDLLGASLNNVSAVNGGQLAGMRNLLINGNLAINQRACVSGAATGASNQYTLDRWRVVTSGQNLAFTASGNGNSMTAPAGGVEQVIEGANIGGGTYVLGWTGTATATVNGTARAKGESFTLTAGANATVRLIGGTTSQVQLEPGGTVTPFEHRPYGMELALCQRYYEEMGAIVFTTAAQQAVNWKITKRALPILSYVFGSGTGAAFSTTTGVGLNTAGVYQNAAHSNVAACTVIGSSEL